MSKEKNKKTADKVQKSPKVAKQKTEKVQKPPKVSKKKARTPATKKKKTVIALVTVLITAALAAGLGLGFGMPKTRKVTFVFGDGAESIVKTAKSGTLLSALIGQLPAPETGYEYVVTDGSGAEMTDKIPDKDISLTVTVRAKKYSLTVETGEGAANVTEVAYGNALTLPQTPAKRGHTFDKWVKAGTNEEVTSATTMPADGLTVKAVWTVNKYILKADVDGRVTTVELAYGSEIKLTKPVKTGYTFAGWTGMPSDGKMPDKELNLTAQWTVSQYDLTFDTNGGNVITLRQVDYNTALGELPTPVKTGYTFSKWVKAGTGEEVTAATLMPLNGLTVQAVWTANPYDLTFDTDGGESIASYTVGYETALGELPTPVKTGYTFSKWVKTGTGEEVTAETLMPLDGLTVQAVWTANPYDLTFDTNGGESIESYTVGYETALGELPTPVKTGYTFSKWVKTGTGEEVTAATTMPLDGLTVQAVWTPVVYDITYDLNGGTNDENNPATYNIESEDVVLNNPTRTGYTFAGWTYDGQTTPAAGVTIAKGNTGDRTFTAVWTLTVYDITYDLNGGTNDESNPANYTIESGAIAIANPTRAGYDFLGWTGTGLTGTVQNVTVAAGSTGDRAYAAVWQVITYNVTYTLGASEVTGDPAVNSTGNPATYTVEDTFTLAIPTLTGYTFLGWVGTGVDTPSTTVTVAAGGTGDRSYTAVWEKASYLLTFDTDGGNTVTSRQLVYNAALGTLPTPEKKPNPQKDEYAFYRWVATIGGTETEVTADTLMPAGGLTVKAQWYALSNLEFIAIDTTAYSVRMSIAGNSAQVPDIVIPSSYQGKPVTAIERDSCSNRLFIKSVKIPESVTSIGNSAFQGCNGLTSITIPSSVTSIGYAAFAGCNGLTSITVDANNANYKSEGNCLLMIDGITLHTGLMTAVIPESVTIIKEFAFAFSELTSITIPKSVTSIGTGSFRTCTRLLSITIPKGVRSIGDNAFYECSALTKIYYTGTPADKSGITMDTGNDAIRVEEKWYYFSATQPSDTSVKYWHYVEGVPTEWI